MGSSIMIPKEQRVHKCLFLALLWTSSLLLFSQVFAFTLTIVKGKTYSANDETIVLIED